MTHGLLCSSCWPDIELFLLASNYSWFSQPCWLNVLLMQKGKSPTIWNCCKFMFSNKSNQKYKSTKVLACCLVVLKKKKRRYQHNLGRNISVMFFESSNNKCRISFKSSVINVWPGSHIWPTSWWIKFHWNKAMISHRYWKWKSYESQIN